MEQLKQEKIGGNKDQMTGRPGEKKVLDEGRIIRILGKDIRGERKVFHGLTSLKGISWGMSNAICKKLKIDKNKTIQDLSETEIKSIIEFIKNPSIPKFMLNRRKDYNSGEDKHLIGSDLDLQKEFDIKRLKKIKCYRGIRHISGQPSRGQRTKSHFRTNRKSKGSVGVAKTKQSKSTAAKPAGKK